MTSHRYVLELAYNGTNYAGWQRQPDAPTVEATVDSALSLLLGEKIKINGCGRTDAGVHSSYYVAHFDFSGTFPPNLLRRYNKYIAEDISLLGVYRVPADFHSRFQAVSRAYTYRITLKKDPFRRDTVASLPQMKDLDQNKMQAAADLLLEYGAFAPFCKSNSDAYTMNCQVTEARWVFDVKEWTFHIAANRFLRGMVRLIVGMCLRVGEGKLQLDEVRHALDKQERLPRPWSAPASGLFLSAVDYPDRATWKQLF